jgi:hypothetical protein
MRRRVTHDMIPNDMKTEEQPKTAPRSFTDTMARAQAEADQPPQLVADQDKLIDEIIDLKQKLNAMVRLGQHSASYCYPQQKADEDLHSELSRAGYGGDEVPE